jgi:hypothetical protein
MPERTITEVFGAGTTQTATELRISKTGLASLLSAAGYQFNPTEANTLDELIAAITCACLAQLTPEAREAEPLTRNVEFNYDVDRGFDSPTIDGQTYNRHTVEVVFYKAIATPKLNPSDLV